MALEPVRGARDSSRRSDDLIGPVGRPRSSAPRAAEQDDAGEDRRSESVHDAARRGLLDMAVSIG